MHFPQPTPQPTSIPEPHDVPYDGVLRLWVDARDVARGIYRVREVIPVSGAGRIVLLYPKWLPGFHAPQAPIELFAGLTVAADGHDLTWERHPVTVNAFYVDVPDGAAAIEAEFQFLSPTDPSQGRVIATSEMLALQWNTVVLYPAGHYARQITVEASLRLPEGWQAACVLDRSASDGATLHFAPTPLDVLVDSPVLAGRHFRRIPLDDRGTVHLNLAGDRPDLIDPTEPQIAAHRAVVTQCDRLFGGRHFDRYEMLLAVSDEMTAIGVEHHRSFDAVTGPDYFTGWDEALARRDTVPHEFVHSWNGKHRRGEDSWSPCFELPIRNSLMWVYEGQTQYWSKVLAARSGLWTREQALGSLALTAATFAARPGSRWRPMIDTTRDPIIAARAPLPWTSWQRSEDYYSEGALIWLDVDTRLRALTEDRHSLDDFARAFFGRNDGEWRVTDTYAFDDVADALNAIAAYDWRGFFTNQLEGTFDGTDDDGIRRGGYRLVFRDEPNAYAVSKDAVFGTTTLTFSIGVTVSSDGALSDVLWDSPAFAAGLTTGTRLLAVNGASYTAEILRQAVAASASGAPIELIVQTGKHVRAVSIAYTGGHRHPHLERVEGRRARLDEIYAPL
ncbi:M61 family metallopeptidase [Sphingomonas hominis]|uniref:M61 family metallopeptidase n=1 Tax=Sphingomonas hominis TaxID=2741495 RepID=UPI001FE81CF8|nr:peptidase M61 [Sphingomonas hominis]